MGPASRRWPCGDRPARASNRPEVALQGDWGARGNIFPPADEAWTVGLTASMGLFDGLIDARTALSRALAGQAEGLYDYHAARADVARAMGLLPTEELSQE